MSRRWIIGLIAGVGVVALIVGAVVFKPWLLFVDVVVDDAVPETVTLVPEASATATAPAGPIELAAGVFVSHEHETTGTATIIENPDGTRVLALTDLATSNGPDVHVWLSTTDVVEGVDGWFVAGGGEFLDLGLIKGNIGNQVYDIPADADLSLYRSVALWCAQFSVSFGAAQLG